MGRQEQETAMYDQPDMTAEQQLMRSEMEQGLHKRADQLRRRVNEDPSKLGDVLDEVMGQQSVDKEVTEEAWAIIREHGEGLVLNWQQWPIVQKLVEQAIISGRAGS